MTEFGVFTENFYEIAQYLKDDCTKTVAMEATDGYESPMVVIFQANFKSCGHHMSKFTPYNLCLCRKLI